MCPTSVLDFILCVCALVRVFTGCLRCYCQCEKAPNPPQGSKCTYAHKHRNFYAPPEGSEFTYQHKHRNIYTFLARRRRRNFTKQQQKPTKHTTKPTKTAIKQHKIAVTTIAGFQTALTRQPGWVIDFSHPNPTTLTESSRLACFSFLLTDNCFSSWSCTWSLRPLR